MEEIWFNWTTNPIYQAFLQREITQLHDTKRSNTQRDRKYLQNRMKRKRKNKILRKIRNAN